MRRRLAVLIALLPVLSLAVTDVAHGAWSTSLAVDNVVTNAPSNQNLASYFSDGAGGLISVWKDLRTSGHNDIYAQRLDADGNPSWTIDGVVVDSVAGNLNVLTACPDDSGGILLAWQRTAGTTANRIMAQRVDANGQIRWGLGGIRAGTVERSQSLPHISRDGAGGAIVVWANWYAVSVGNVYGQRLSRDGVRLWDATGDSLVARGEIRSLDTCARPGGGAYIGWWQTFGVPSAIAVDNARVRVMPIDTITTAASQTSPPGLYAVRSGTGAFFMMAGGLQMHIRHFDTSGGTWPSSRRVVSTSHSQAHPQFVEDGEGGALLAWRDGRTGTPGIYAQRIREDGTFAWTADGVFISNAVTSNGGGHAIASDGMGGAWLGWSQVGARWVQHVRPDGGFWLPAAMNISNNSNYGYTYDAATFVPGTNGSTIFVWTTNTSTGTLNDILAKRFFANGTLSTLDVASGPAGGSALRLAAGPSPARGDVMLRFALPRAGHAKLELFGLQGERVATLENSSLAAGSHLRAVDTSRLAPGVYGARLTTSDGVATAKFVRVK